MLNMPPDEYSPVIVAATARQQLEAWAIANVPETQGTWYGLTGESGRWEPNPRAVLLRWIAAAPDLATLKQWVTRNRVVSSEAAAYWRLPTYLLSDANKAALLTLIDQL